MEGRREEEGELGREILGQVTQGV